MKQDLVVSMKYGLQSVRCGVDVCRMEIVLSTD
jgi:hypothetical protein